MSPSQRQISAGTASWLEEQAAQWVQEGIVSAEAATRIRERYDVRADAPQLPRPALSRRVLLTRLVTTLGATFVSAGLIWLVAANLDLLSPLVRFVLLAAVWLALTLGAVVLAERRTAAGDVASPVVAAVQLLAGAAYGAVVFQAGQSLQVPAYTPVLVLVWGLGALLYAYAVAGRTVALLAIVLLAIWYVWQVASLGRGRFGFVVAVLIAAVVCAAVGALHARVPQRFGVRDFGALWSHLGAGLALMGLFAAALPFGRSDAWWSHWGTAGGVLAAVLAALVLFSRERDDRLETALAGAVAVCGILLALWQVDTQALSSGTLDTNGLLRVAASVVLYLGAASGYAVLGALRSRPILTLLATIALVIFLTFQAFAVFAPILPGSVLFLVVGGVLLGTGFLADRGRRRIEAAIEEGRP